MLHRFCFLLLCASLLSAPMAQSQNLVPNGSFEEFTTNCTSGLGYGFLEDWGYIMCSNLPGLFHACNNDLNNGSGVPQGGFGFQAAHTGDGYVMINTLLVHSQGPIEDGNPQMYANVNLTDPLVAGQHYCLRLWMNMADSSCYRTSAFHAFLWYGEPTVCNYQDTAWDTYASVTWDISTVDTSEWTLLEGEFEANGGEANLTLGAFQFEEEIDSVFIADYSGINEGVLTSIYFIDDVELWACTVGMSDQDAPEGARVYPNPASDFITVQLPLTSGKAQLELISADGRVISEQVISAASNQLAVAQIPPGQYTLHVRTAERTFVEKIVVRR
jgi:hypothetical protein